MVFLKELCDGFLIDFFFLLRDCDNFVFYVFVRVVNFFVDE